MVFVQEQLKPVCGIRDDEGNDTNSKSEGNPEDVGHVTCVHASSLEWRHNRDFELIASGRL